jgi:hypothetical protein
MTTESRGNRLRQQSIVSFQHQQWMFNQQGQPAQMWELHQLADVTKTNQRGGFGVFDQSPGVAEISWFPLVQNSRFSWLHPSSSGMWLAVKKSETCHKNQLCFAQTAGFLVCEFTPDLWAVLVALALAGCHIVMFYVDLCYPKMGIPPVLIQVMRP